MALEISMSVLVSIPVRCCVGAQPFLQFSLLPASGPEKDGSELLSGPAQEEAWSAKVGAAIQPPWILRTPLPIALQPLMALAITANTKRFFGVLFFFLSSPLMQTHLDYLSKDFPFPFLERHQGPACPFHHKGGWKERGVSRVSPERSE